jgi:ferredoxin
MNDLIEKKVSDYLIRVDRKKCIGSAQCVIAVPELFTLDDENLCSFNNYTKEVNRDQLFESYYLCPVGAIYLFDVNGKQIIP